MCSLPYNGFLVLKLHRISLGKLDIFMNSQIMVLAMEAGRKRKPTSEIHISYSKDEILPPLSIRGVQ